MDIMILKEDIIRLKQELGEKVVIPAHHYQNPEVVNVSDFVGDSYQLAVDCSHTAAEFIIFCGVYFMAEAADILSDKKQTVIMPALDARCPMADQIGFNQMKSAFELIKKMTSKPIAPVIYMNSNAEVKNFCGNQGGSVCTSSNAAKIVHYYLARGKAVFFAPDFNLGMNTANQLKLTPEEVVTVTQDFKLLGIPERAKIFLWDGFCYVHKRFMLSDIDNLRQNYPNIRIIVHPECDVEVVQAADDVGSTAKIYAEIKKSAAGSVWGVGTENHFVQRIAAEFPDKIVLPLRKSICGNMAKITLEKLLKSLQSVQSHLQTKADLKGIVQVVEKTKTNAYKALHKMIEIVEK